MVRAVTIAPQVPSLGADVPGDQVSRHTVRIWLANGGLGINAEEALDEHIFPRCVNSAQDDAVSLLIF